ncbi:hypothetical protein FJR45_02895 [Sulfurimonas sediminis]|uniref:Uncharacterized protein n=1 Tax=Sulfurimonas sediminis TaxID=2590020 RepID=A0A7M1AZT5_9BACT|nr:hypothetical protein [Sulfurimonas sediminis]QOP42953.1 hypothetical protein FJR45_02895 [Sulfurimonas sediminis]
MKQLITTMLVLFSLIVLNGCVNSALTVPSQNSDLNKISNSNGKVKPGLMQKNLDNWLKNEWAPTVNEDKKVQKKYMKKVDTQGTNTSNDTEEKYVEDKERNFTLQEYVDKAAAYSKAHPNEGKDSHVKKLESMPVIGD